MQEMQYFPFSGLEAFSNGTFLYSPVEFDINSFNVTSTLSPALLAFLFPAIALSEPALLQSLDLPSASLLTREEGGEHEEQEDWLCKTLRTVLKDFVVGSTAVHSKIMAVLFGGSDKKEEVRRSLDRMAMTLVAICGLAISTLQDTTLTTCSPLVSRGSYVIITYM